MFGAGWEWTQRMFSSEILQWLQADNTVKEIKNATAALVQPVLASVSSRETGHHRVTTTSQ